MFLLWLICASKPSSWNTALVIDLDIIPAARKFAHNGLDVIILKIKVVVFPGDIPFGINGFLYGYRHSVDRVPKTYHLL